MRDSNFKRMMFTLSVAAACLLGCSCGESAADADSQGAFIHLDVACKTVPLSDSLVLDLVGPDTFHVVLSKNETVFDKTLNPGEWNFYAKYYANGMLVEKGEAAATLAAGESVTVSVAMHAVAGYLYVQIPLGLENSLGIAKGTLSVSADGTSDAYKFTIADGFATAVTGALVLGKTYTVRLELFSQTGTLLFQSTTQVTNDKENFVQNWTLSSLYADVSFKISADSLKTLAATAFFPSKLRAPQKGDLLLTEVMTEGKEEFVEYYNASLDTLDLMGCGVWTSNSSSLKLATDSTFAVKLPPNAFLVLGRDTLAWVDASASFTLPGTKGAVVFRCGAETLDSLFYVSEKTLAADSTGLYTGLSAFPIDAKYSMQLPFKNYKKRYDGTSWCNGEISLHAPAFCAE